MAHFAKVEKGIVKRVIVAEQDFIDNYVDDTPGEWVQTSYNTHGGVHYDPITGEPSADQTKALRKNYAGKGYTYDRDRDAFIPKSPYPSWTLNETTCLWEPPVPEPDGQHHTWNESTQTWELTAYLNE